MAAKFQNGVKKLFYKFQCKGVAMQKRNSGALKKNKTTYRFSLC